MKKIFLLSLFCSGVFASSITPIGGGGGGAAVWGGITGTLSDQTDLQTALNLKAPLASPTFTGSVTLSSLTASTVPYLNSGKILTSSAVTPTELGYVSGVTSAIQTQLSTKAPLASPTFSGSVTLSGLSASTVPYLDSGKILTSSSVTPTELGYVSGVTSAVQTQLNAKAPLASPTFSGTITASAVTASGAATFSGLTASTVPYLDSGKILTSSSVTPTELGYVSGVTSAIQTQLNAKALSSNATLTGASTSIKKGNCYITNVESDLGSSGSALTIDVSTANVFTVTLDSATPTITITNYANNGCPTAFIFTQDSTGNRVPTFSGPTIVWANGVHTLSVAANAVDKVTCIYNGSTSGLMCDLGTSYQ